MLTLQQIIKKFESKGRKTDLYLPKEQIIECLNEINNKDIYNREVAEQLLDQTPSQIQNLKVIAYRLSDLAQTMIDATNILQDKIKKANAQVQAYKEYRLKIDSQLASTSPSSDERYLYITIIQISNIQLKIRYLSCFLNLVLGQTSHVAKPIQNHDKFNPEFNVEFEFQIPALVPLLCIQFYIINESNTQLLVGQTTLQLQSLEDSNIKELDLAFKDAVGREIQTEVKLEALIVLNKHQHLLSQKQKYDTKIFNFQTDIKEYTDDLNVIMRPFSNDSADDKERQKLQIFNAWKKKEEQKEEERQMQYQVLGENQNQSQQVLSVHDAPQEVQAAPIEEDYFESDQLNHGIIVFLLYALLTMFICFAKPSFMDFLVSYGMFFVVLLDQFDPSHVKLVGIGLVASIFYDMIWLKQYHLWWTSDDENNPEWGLEAINLLRFVLLLTYMQFLYKFVVCYYLYHFYKASEDPTKQYKFVIWKFEFRVGQHKNLQVWQ
ncbi:hypothetical protein pb186bvf_009273 [Paramecium bursaria]